MKKHWSEFEIKKVIKGGKDYPKILLDLAQPPKQLYYRGELDLGALDKTIAIVGSRGMTRYGASCVTRFVSSFVQAGITTVSGYMYGVDTEVHTQTVDFLGKTVAVMGNGLNQPYPPDNDKLYTKILQSGGAVLSEYEPDQKPKLWMYPQRNRIVAALATVGVLVIEAGESSGSLITVDFAKKLKKKIYAIPGPINSSVSMGTNQIIKEGIAQIVTVPEDILRIPTKASVSHQSKITLSNEEKKILGILKNEDLNIDEIAVATGMGMVEASTTLSVMALKGLIAEAGGRYYVV